MTRRALKVCSAPGCPRPTASGRCADCRAAANSARRRTPEQRAYKSAGHRKFRTAVLRRDPRCVLCGERPSEHADHHPRSRRELVDAGLDPNDPAHGRGLCQACHSAETARHQPGGWNARH